MTGTSAKGPAQFRRERKPLTGLAYAAQGTSGFAERQLQKIGTHARRIVPDARAQFFAFLDSVHVSGQHFDDIQHVCEIEPSYDRVLIVLDQELARSPDAY